MFTSTGSIALRRLVSHSAPARRSASSFVAARIAPQQSSAAARGLAVAGAVALAGYTMLPRAETVRIMKAAFKIGVVVQLVMTVY